MAPFPPHIAEKGGSCRGGNLGIDIEFFYQGYTECARVTTQPFPTTSDKLQLEFINFPGLQNDIPLYHNFYLHGHLEAVFIVFCEEVVRVNSLLAFLPFYRVANCGLYPLGVGGGCHLQNKHSVQRGDLKIALE